MAEFLEQHNLGLITRISEVVNDIRDEQSSFEKKRNVKAIKEMVTIGKTNTGAARPQVSTVRPAFVHQLAYQI